MKKRQASAYTQKLREKRQASKRASEALGKRCVKADRAVGSVGLRELESEFSDARQGSRVCRQPSLFQGQQSLIPREPAHDDGVVLREHGRGVNGHDL